jgi:hypothetical protein
VHHDMVEKWEEVYRQATLELKVGSPLQEFARHCLPLARLRHGRWHVRPLWRFRKKQRRNFRSVRTT